jgi:hypothetical protein
MSALRAHPWMRRRAFLAGVGGMTATLAGRRRLADAGEPGTTGDTPRSAGTRDGRVHQVTGVHELDELLVPADVALTFDPDVSTTITVTGNAIVAGTLRMRPARPDVVHTLRFRDVDESAYVGETGSPVDSDVGLWVVGQGALDLRGTPRQGWNRTGWHPTWRPDDEVRRAPHARGDLTHFRRHRREDDVPSVPGPDGRSYATEIFNLTRNVIVEGAPGHRAHVLFASGAPQSVRYALFRWLGPRRPSPQAPAFHQASAQPGVLPESEYPPDYFSAQRVTDTEPVLSRYPVHFHHCHDGSRGSIVEGCVVRDSSRAFVPHASTGITFRDCVAFGITDDAYWWDDAEETDDLVWDHCAAFDVRSDPETRGMPAGFVLGVGRRLVVRDCAAAAVRGGEHSSGFQWPAFANHAAHNVWESSDLVAHNCGGDGVYVWQDDDHRHHVERLVSYRNSGSGLVHGARRNAYRYDDLVLFDNDVADLWHQALCTGEVIRAKDQVWFGVWAPRLHIGGHTQTSERPVSLHGAHLERVTVAEDGLGHGRYELHADLDSSHVRGVIVRSRITVVRPDGTTFDVPRG